jgi:hypothetical protein
MSYSYGFMGICDDYCIDFDGKNFMRGLKIP